jgi:hypothetical protein
MSILGIRVAAEPLRSLGFAEITGDFAAIGDPFVFESRLVMIQNFTDELLLFSLNGIDEHFPLGAGSQIILDLCSDKTDQAGAWVMPAGQIIWTFAPIDNPTLGEVYVSTFYGAS